MFVFANFAHYKYFSACHDLRTITTKFALLPGTEPLPARPLPVGDWEAFHFLRDLGSKPTVPCQFAPAVEIIDWQPDGTFTEVNIYQNQKIQSSPFEAQEIVPFHEASWRRPRDF